MANPCLQTYDKLIGHINMFKMNENCLSLPLKYKPVLLYAVS